MQKTEESDRIKELEKALEDTGPEAEWDKRHPETAVVVQEKPETTLELVAAAMKKGYTPELIEKMMDLAERNEKNEARKAYVRDMAAFKANPPEILKTKHVSYKNSKNQVVEWDHAELGEICEAIIEGLSQHNFYHRWGMKQPEKMVKTTCIITHALGHSEKTSMSGPPDTSGGKDELKAVASTNTIQQRLTLLALTGLAAKGMDTNGSGIDPDEFITKDQAKKLHDLISGCGDKAEWVAEQILKLNDIETIDALPAAGFKNVVKWISEKVK